MTKKPLDLRIEIGTLKAAKDEKARKTLTAFSKAMESLIPFLFKTYDKFSITGWFGQAEAIIFIIHPPTPNDPIRLTFKASKGEAGELLEYDPQKKRFKIYKWTYSIFDHRAPQKMADRLHDLWI